MIIYEFSISEKKKKKIVGMLTRSFVTRRYAGNHISHR